MDYSHTLPNFVKVKRKISPAGVTLKTAAIIGLALLCVLFLFPVVWMVVSSFKTQDQIYTQLSSWRTFLPDRKSVV